MLYGATEKTLLQIERKLQNIASTLSGQEIVYDCGNQTGATQLYSREATEKTLLKIDEELSIIEENLNDGGDAGGSALTPSQIKEIAAQAAQVLEPEVNKLKDDLAALQTAKMERYSIKTVMDSVATPHTQYFLGEQTAVDIVLPDTADVGQIISVSWYNGDTAATLSITGTMLDFDYTPSANTRSEINALWDGTYWAVLGNEMEVPIDA